MMMLLAGLFGLSVVASIVDTTSEPRLDEDDGDGPDPGGTTGDVVSGSDLSDILSGTAENDIIEGGAGDDQLNGFAGDDGLSGDTGDDALVGDAGADVLWGGDGADTLHGGDGNDTLAGGDGNDTAFGMFGDDDITGGAGDDSLSGGEGADTLLGGAGNDALHGWSGDDGLTGGQGHDTLQGGDGADVLDGREKVEPQAETAGGPSPDTADTRAFQPTGDTAALQEQDFLNGGAGDDVILAGAGDYATGGDGADSFAVDDWLNEPAGPATIADFNPHEDSLAIVYDPDRHPDPQLTLTPSEDDPSVLHLALDGHVVAHVLGNPDFGPGSVNLIPKGLLDAA